jgi:hypothetical protein
MKRAPKAGSKVSPKHSKTQQQQQQQAGQQEPMPSFMQAPAVPQMQNPGQQMFDPTQALGTGFTP